MVPLLFLLRGLRTKEDNEKERKSEKRSEIQCMILLKSHLYVFIQPINCFQKGKLIIDFISLKTHLWQQE